ncbi:hypothetical protein [Salinispora vitiensis]|uniref:hypothetical protein n=1 Tax=Salinispora vitiensis TaxID=999544 RepID=UPI00036EA234|nr:hypothetical protein [Salinispora vitiensis]
MRQPMPTLTRPGEYAYRGHLPWPVRWPTDNVLASSPTHLGCSFLDAVRAGYTGFDLAVF